MKTLIITLSIIITSFAAKAHQSKPDTTYYQNPGLHKFDGTWEYSDGNITFRIVLKTEKKFIKRPNNFIDLLYGYHVYTKSEKVLQNSIGQEKTIRNGYYTDEHISTNKISFLFTDMQSKKSLRGTLELLSNNEIVWKVKILEGVRIKIAGQKEEDENIYVPTNLILKKVN